jgi:cytoskeletal protein CcmA (bactofilin family)
MAFWNKTRDDATAPAPPDDKPAAPASPAPQRAPLREEHHPMAMLKRDEVPTPAAGGSDLNALLGRGSEFEGKLTFEGTVRIDGKFTGSIQSGDVLVVGEGAKISAEISCGTIIVHGEVTGNIRAKNAVELHHPARVRGNIETPSLMVEKGVIFEGQAKMENLDKSGFGAKPAAAGAPAPAPVAAVKS